MMTFIELILIYKIAKPVYRAIYLPVLPTSLIRASSRKNEKIQNSATSTDIFSGEKI